jgi:AcrR family transcriptional regulator
VREAHLPVCVLLCSPVREMRGNGMMRGALNRSQAWPENMTRNPEREPHSKPREAWDGDRPDPAAARERLLEVAPGCIERNGIPATGIAHVAQEAGVSRPTVYRYFKDREELIRSVLLQAGLRLANEVQEQIRAFDDPGDKVVEATLFTLRAIRENAVLREVWQPAMFDAYLLQGFTQPASIMFTRVALSEIIESTGWDEDEATEAMEFMLRMILSLLAAPEPVRSEVELRHFLRRRLVPALGL